MEMDTIIPNWYRGKHLWRRENAYRGRRKIEMNRYLVRSGSDVIFSNSTKFKLVEHPEKLHQNGKSGL
jgi:hypothetical protein